MYSSGKGSETEKGQDMGKYQTKGLTSHFRTAEKLTAIDTEAYTVTLTEGTFTVSFDDLAEALKALESAKAKAWNEYLRAGGNPANKRAVGAQFASVKKAMVASV